MSKYSDILDELEVVAPCSLEYDLEVNAALHKNYMIVKKDGKRCILFYNDLPNEFAIDDDASYRIIGKGGNVHVLHVIRIKDDPSMIDDMYAVRDGKLILIKEGEGIASDLPDAL